MFTVIRGAPAAVSFENVGRGPTAGYFFLFRQEKVTKEKGAPDSDSQSVEREGAQAATRRTVN